MRIASRWQLIGGLVCAGLLPACPALAGSSIPITSSVTISVRVPEHTGSLELSGRASPNSIVTFMENGNTIGTVTSDATSFFDKILSGLEPIRQTFDIYTTDDSGHSTNTSSVSTTIISDSTVTLSGFLLPPTLGVSKPTMSRPDHELLSGKTIPNASITILVDGVPLPNIVNSDSLGVWSGTPPQVFHLGNHQVVTLVQDSQGNQSQVGATVQFTVSQSSDLSLDGLVNLTDFSILLYSYGQTPPPNPAADINDDSKVDLVDFSIMLYNWTG